MNISTKKPIKFKALALVATLLIGGGHAVAGTEEDNLLLDEATYNTLADIAVKDGADMIIHSLGGDELSEKEKAAVRAAFKEAWVETFPRKDWEEPIMKVYKNNLTAEEIKKLQEFYRSELGKKVSKMQPELIDTITKYGEKLANERGDRFVAALTVKLMEKATEIDGSGEQGK